MHECRRAPVNSAVLHCPLHSLFFRRASANYQLNSTFPFTLEQKLCKCGDFIKGCIYTLIICCLGAWLCTAHLPGSGCFFLFYMLQHSRGCHSLTLLTSSRPKARQSSWHHRAIGILSPRCVTATHTHLKYLRHRGQGSWKHRATMSSTAQWHLAHLARQAPLR